MKLLGFPFFRWGAGATVSLPRDIAAAIALDLVAANLSTVGTRAFSDGVGADTALPSVVVTLVGSTVEFENDNAKVFTNSAQVSVYGIGREATEAAVYQVFDRLDGRLVQTSFGSTIQLLPQGLPVLSIDGARNSAGREEWRGLFTVQVLIAR